jgi:hypothetical protein
MVYSIEDQAKHAVIRAREPLTSDIPEQRKFRE